MPAGAVYVANARGGPRTYAGRLTAVVVLCCTQASISGFLFGYDLGITGGVTAMPNFLRKMFPEIFMQMAADKLARAAGLEANNPYCSYNSQKLQAFTSTFFLLGLWSAMMAAKYQLLYGRKWTMVTSGFAYLLGAVLGAIAPELATLVVGRAFLGVGVGFANASAPLYLSEMPLPKHRGFFNQCFQWMTTIGILAAGLVNYGTQHMDTPGHVQGWRLSVGLAGVFGLLLLVGGLCLPDTPNSLIARGKPEAALKVLQRIRGSGVDVRAEFNDIMTAVEGAKKVDFWALLYKRKYRGVLTATFLIPFYQQFTGINTIMFFSANLFSILGKGEEASLLNVVIIGAVNVVATLAAMFLADRLGRKFLLLAGSIQMIVSFIVVAGIMGATFNTTTGFIPSWSARSVIAFECLFTSAFAWSWGPLGWLIPSEMHNTETRSLGMGIATAVNFLFSFIIGQTYLTMLCSMEWGTYVMFAFFVLLNIVYVVFFLPETRGRHVEDMEAVWAAHWFWGRVCYPDVHERRAIAAQLQRDPEEADNVAVRPAPTAGSSSGSDSEDPKLAKAGAGAEEISPDAKVMPDTPVQAAAQQRPANAPTS